MDEDYDIVPATVDDKERIAEYLRYNFYPNEPLNLAVGTPLNRPIEAIRGLLRLSDGTSFIAITKSGEIIGVVLNEEFTEEEVHEYSKPAFHNEAYYKVFTFVTMVEHNANILGQTGLDRGLFLHILSVHPKAGGRGIGKALMTRSRDTAKAKGHPLLAIMCSSYYSARIAESIGMECIYRLPYSEYKNEKGEQVFIPPPPHKEVKMYVLKL
ncbi:Dopamine N-acetyltransferase [Blattella germanica]|nr:Dopamine N-acetyltransferase [Blattella germanica]